MPRPVVPILLAPRASSRARSISPCERQDQRRVVGELQVVGRDGDALRRDRLDLARCSAQGSTTTPLPMIDSLSGRTTPEGSRLSLIGRRRR